MRTSRTVKHVSGRFPPRLAVVLGNRWCADMLEGSGATGRPARMVTLSDCRRGDMQTRRRHSENLRRRGTFCGA